MVGAVGVVLAWVAVTASVVNVIGLALPVQAPGDPGAPVWLEITYAAAFLGILVGLLLLGAAVLRARALPHHWSAVPLIVGILWFPLQGFGLVLGGLAWMLLGYVIPLQKGEPVRR